MRIYLRPSPNVGVRGEVVAKAGVSPRLAAAVCDVCVVEAEDSRLLARWLLAVLALAVDEDC